MDQMTLIDEFNDKWQIIGASITTYVAELPST
jgi:hypothetical protein